MILSINTIKNENITFQKSSKLKRVSTYRDLKLIPNLNCACCDKKMINPKKFNELFCNITLPLETMINEGFFAGWEKSPVAWNLLNFIAKAYPKKSLDQINLLDEKDNHGLFEAVRKSLILNPRNTSYYNDDELFAETKNLYKDIIYRSRGKLVDAKTVLNKFKVFKKSLSKQKLETFIQLEIYAQKYSNKTLSEILAIDEIYKFHATKDLLQRAETREKLDYHFGNIKKMITKKNPELEEDCDILKDNALELFKVEKDSCARLPKIKEMYNKFLEERGCQKLIKAVDKELEQIPITFITKDSFLAYAHRHKLNDFQILSSILTPSVANYEDIIPLSKGGRKGFKNGLVFCKDCNIKRSSTPYTEFITYHPEMLKNVKKQIDKIAKFILKNDASQEATLYPFGVSDTLRNYTNGLIDIDTSIYYEKLINSKQSE